jgi:hypothetical protein
LSDRPDVTWPVMGEVLAALGETPIWLVEE